jgi:hypothetical protein
MATTEQKRDRAKVDERYLWNLADIFRYLDDSDLFDDPPLDINFLNDPPFYCVQILPPAMKTRAAGPITRLADALDRSGRESEASSVRAITNFMNAADGTRHIEAFFTRTDKLDAFRNERFDDTFPELADLRGSSLTRSEPDHQDVGADPDQAAAPRSRQG